MAVFGRWRKAEKSVADTFARNKRRHQRPLRLERLEDRRLLAITVTTLLDEADGSIVDGDISLRDAIAAAPAGEMIDFAPDLTSGGPATLNLTINSAITVNKALTISGPGAALLTIDASMLDPTPNTNNGDGRRIFVIDDASATRRAVTLQGLTLTGADANAFGGAIFSNEALTLRNLVIRNNAATQGAAVGAGGTFAIFDSEIYHNQSTGAGGALLLSSAVAFDYQIVGTTIRNNSSGGRGGGLYSVVPFGSAMHITDSLISNNTAALDGGGITSTGPLMVTRSAIVGNQSSMNGGGIKAINALTVENSLIDDNTAANGGGIHADAMATIRNSTISNNDVSGNAGGIYIQNNGSTLTQVTVSKNTAGGSGGGIYTTQAIAIRHSTIAENWADDDGGGGGGGGLFGSQPVGSPIIVDQTIVAKNVRAALVKDDISGAVALRYSLIGDNTGATITNNGNNIIGTMAAPVDPLLGSLAANDAPPLRGGHFALTHLLLANSPALDAGDTAAMAGVGTTPTTDERGTGFGRVVNATLQPSARIDIGAIEQQPAPLFADYNGDHTVNAADYTIWRNTRGSTSDLSADGDRDGVVDSDDYLYWKAHYGETAPLGSGASILASLQVAKGEPEPIPAAEKQDAFQTVSFSPVGIPAAAYGSQPAANVKLGAAEIASGPPETLTDVAALDDLLWGLYAESSAGRSTSDKEKSVDFGTDSSSAAPVEPLVDPTLDAFAELGADSF